MHPECAHEVVEVGVVEVGVVDRIKVDHGTADNAGVAPQRILAVV